MLESRTRKNIMFSCVGQEKVDYDPFVPDHALAFVINGTMVINDGNKSLNFEQGEIGFISKNQLVRTQKIPNDNKPFTAISIFLPSETLFEYAKEFKIEPKGNYIGEPNFSVFKNDFLKEYLDSMLPYFENPDVLTDNLARFKTWELIEILIKDNRMQNILFKFNDDFKLDIEAYMNKNYMHNIPLEQFAALTGRSLSTFKRDFQSIFGITPNKWLIKKRLDLAYYLIATKGKKPSDAFIEAGFVNFSHFSKSFKAEFRVSPSET